MMGLANKVKPYVEEDVDFLTPIISGYANFIKSTQYFRERIKTEQKNKEIQQLYDLIAQNSKDIIAVHDLDLTFRYVSPSIFDVLGYKPEEVIGKKPSEVFSSTVVPASLPETGKRLVLDHMHKNGQKLVRLEILSEVLYDDEGIPTGTIAVSRDVTQREEILLELQESLSREKELNQLKSRFISMISHEFRTPLSTILSSTELLTIFSRKVNEPELKEKLRLHLSRINGQIYRLSGIISDVLVLDKNAHEKKAVNKEIIPLCKFFESLVFNNFMDHNGERLIELELPLEDKEVVTEPTWLTHIFRNILENSLKYSGVSDLKPVLKLTYGPSSYCVTIRDYGIGIPDEEQKYIFESFFRAKNVANIKGTGLGLNIVKEFLANLGGEISFESTFGKGTAFKVELPYAY